MPWVVLAIGFLGAAGGTGLVRRYAMSTRMIDEPNARSSHAVPTPRGGGLAIVIAVLLAAVFLYVVGITGLHNIVGWTLGVSGIAYVGFLDDRRGVLVSTRLWVHALCAMLLVGTFGLQPIPWLGKPLDLGWVGEALAVIAVVWSINLFNFMDGIDGIAAAQAAFVFLVAAALTYYALPNASSYLWFLSIVSASMGFLIWNWPPARIFLGDVGSGSLGFLIAAGAMQSSNGRSVSVWTWIILNGAFLADATVTLLVRASRRQRLSIAHRSHVYQRLSRRWRSHRAVVFAYLAVNILWLLPWAVWTVIEPSRALGIATAAVTPVFVAAFVLGGGRVEELPET